MSRDAVTPVRTLAALLVAVALLFSSCGDDDSSADDASSDPTGDETTPETPEIEGSVDDDGLVVPRAYLQGEWCDGDGQNWTIEGDTATLDDGSGGTGEFAVDILFVRGPGFELISQTDDQFVAGSADEQLTFTRGAC